MIDVSKQSVDDMRALLRAIGKLDPELRKRLQRTLRELAGKTAEKVRGRQRKKSGALRKRTRAGVRAGQAEIRGRAPYTRIHEFGGRHPVFGKDTWVFQPAQPAIFNTVVEDQPQYINGANKAFDEAAKELKFK